ncbi:hypothetical protein [Brevundimonas diminuta]|uniref:hypothetical protein n=1 Tax=Brevundimonas diminuta TaxID=293 RepID=UPI0025A560DD|nr:hypothetical protein [Brevundimonas diminuta]MDM8352865.1 hypothetical protein [Brevundimonas diminuta]
MTMQPLSSAARAGAGSSAARSANNGAPDADSYPFNADPVGFDVYRLDSAVDALRGADLSNHRDELTRIAGNLADLMEPQQ